MSELNVSKVKAVFMDIGGVLLTNGWDYQSREKAAKVFNFDFQEMNILHNFIYNVFEIGSVSLDQYLNTILFYSPRDFTKEEFIEFMFAQSTELPQMLEWLKKWKTQTDLPVFAVSNENLDLNEYRIKTFQLHEVFDGFFSSCYVGARKPDPRIFKMAMDITQVKPDECIYFDDRPMLVNAAKNLGMTSILHENFETTKNILENFIR
ncbi:HAD family phosphatase [Chryseobacterium sp. MEBOG06]|uniref:HAD family hydrolase n=1 Tax=unclassified Chryseobacterium TaxID=2593645 RepID=UPI001F1E2EAF|nr:MULTISPECIES: HAD family phosphatase [unclassified Chryseobacterium]UKB86046.1 HAD family phosphatase [Chryseobacterium sp. MEBOG06]